MIDLYKNGKFYTVKHNIKKKYFDILLQPQIQYVNQLPTNIKDAIKKYTFQYDWKVNKYLQNDQHLVKSLENPNPSQSRFNRGFDINRLEYGYEFVLNKNIKDVKRLLDAAFKNSPPTTKEITLYRGIRYNKGDKYEHEPVFNKQYISTTTSETVAKDFKGKDIYCCIMKIKIPKGSHILPLYNYSRFQGEFEVLLPRDGKFIINKQVGPIVHSTFIENVDITDKKTVKLHPEIYKNLNLVIPKYLYYNDDFEKRIDYKKFKLGKNAATLSLYIDDDIYNPKKILYLKKLTELSKMYNLNVFNYTIETNKQKYTLYIKNGHVYTTKPK